MFQHYIVTRFNLRRADWTTTKNNEIVLSDSWLKERFDLFENYCFPSVKNQLNQNFKWLVFFDINTPENYKLKIQEYKSSFKNFTPFFIDGMESFLPSTVEKVTGMTDKEYIITSRLDNDDSLHPDYIGVVQSCFDNQNYLAIDIIDGYRMQIGANVRIGVARFLYNPYISLIEKKENCKTVWYYGHTYWKYEKNIFRVKNKRLWLTILHGKNMANVFGAYGNVNTSILNEFNIPIAKINELDKNYESCDLWRFQNFKNRFRNYATYYGKEFKRIIGIYKLKKYFAKNDYD